MPDADARTTQVLDAAVVRTWVRLAATALARERDAIDQVNVFPVADADTGTNMYLTVREAARAAAAAPATAGAAAVLRGVARGALLGARGNSGVILSEWLRGMALATTRGDGLARMLDVAATTARAAVAHPEPGTILTAADVAAARARDAAASPGSRAADVLEAAVGGARDAARTSVTTLAPLARAGVLDAGACGFVLVLDALRLAHTARPAEPPVTLGLELAGLVGPARAVVGPAVVVPGATGRRGTHGLDRDRDDDHGHDRRDDDELEVMFVLRRPAGVREFPDGGVAEGLRADLAAVGGSVVVVGGAGLGADDDSAWQAHVHTRDLRAALAVAHRWAGRGRVEPVHVRHVAVPDAGLDVVASTDAPGLAAELARAGATVLVPVPPVAVLARDLALAAVSATTKDVLVLETAGRVVAPAVARLAAEHDDGALPRVVPVSAPTDVHAVVVAAALAAASDAPGADVADAVRDALRTLRTAVTDVDVAPGALRTLLADGGEVVTLLVDDLVAQDCIAELSELAGRHGAECLVLRTGRTGTGVAIGVEG